MFHIIERNGTYHLSFERRTGIALLAALVLVPPLFGWYLATTTTLTRLEARVIKRVETDMRLGVRLVECHNEKLLIQSMMKDINGCGEGHSGGILNAKAQ